MKGFIVYPSYRIKEGKAQVLLYGRLENGESFATINDFKPYFWIKQSDKKIAEKILKDMDTKNITIEDSKFKNFDDEEMSKVILAIPREVPELKKIFMENNVISYEADIRFSYRYMIDKGIKAGMEIKGKTIENEFMVDKVFENPELTPTDFSPKLKIVSIDIETDMKNSKIWSISLYSEDIKKVLFLGQGNFKNAECFKTEKELLEKFKEEIIKYDPDVITGWNLIDFDLMIIKDRFKQNSIQFILGRTNQECSIRLTDSYFIDSKANFPGRTVIDAMSLMKVSFMRLDDYKLQTAAKTILGEGKLITADHRGTEIERLYKEEPQKLIDYNLKDSELVYRIVEKTNILNLTIQRSKLTGMQLDRVNASIASLDSLYLRELKEKKIIAPSAFVNERDERIKGGFVMQSKPGIYDGIIVLDFKSLYPSIIRTFNIDPLSFVPDDKYRRLSTKEQSKLIESPNKAHFKNTDGILPIIIQRLWEQRDIAKKKKDDLASQAIKITMNSFFGVLANPTCRFYSTDMANAITHFGQFLNKMTAKKIEEKGYEVIYGDTDSIFVNVGDSSKADKVGKELQVYINEFYQNYVKDFKRKSFLELEYEKSFRKFLMPKVRGSEKGAKKRYAGLTDDGKMTIVGLEFVRRDWTELSKKFQMGLLEHIFADKPIDTFVKNFVNELRKGKLDSLLIYKKAIRKAVSAYTKTTPPHIKAARKLGRDHVGLIEYLITINGPEPLEKQPSKIDYEHYIKKQLKPIADSILSFQDKSFDDLIAKQKQTSLFSFE